MTNDFQTLAVREMHMVGHCEAIWDDLKTRAGSFPTVQTYPPAAASPERTSFVTDRKTPISAG